jgi:hypothetical protein
MTYSTVLARLAAGADGTVLTADSSQGTGLKWSYAAGTVTSVGLALPANEWSITNSPVTGAGTLTGSWKTQVKNRVFIGPISGADATPTFRVLDSADLGLTTKGDILGRSSTDLVRIPVGSDGQVLKADSGAASGVSWYTLAGEGTVTSVGLTAPSEISVSGSPVTAAGTIALSWANVVSNRFFAGPASGGNSAPAFRALSINDLGLSAKGDLLTTDGNTYYRLAVGTNNYALVADSTTATGLKWANVNAGGTVTSVGLSMPSWFSVANSPVTTTGTLTVTAASGQTANNFLATPNGSSGAVGLRAIVSADLPANTTSQAGIVTTAPNDVAKFWRGDASWALPPQGTVTSVGLSAPSEITVSGSPIIGSGTLGLGWATETANHVFAGPATGAPDVPTFRALVAADLPVFVASGASHAKGAVPDPGVTAGTTKFLREDASWQVPTFNSSIEVKEVDGSPDATAVSVLRFNQADGFSVTDNGSGIATVACASCSGGGATAAKQDTFSGDGSTQDFTLTATPATNGVIYVALNGLPQPKTTAWTISGSIVSMVTAPITGAMLTVGYFTSLPLTVTHTQDDWTGSGGTDFTLTHAPATNGMLVVALRGLIQPQSSWTIVGGTTLRMSSPVTTGDILTASYNY